MKIFIDTAKVSEIREAISWGVVDGVTTNPTLIRKAIEEERSSGRDVELEAYVGEICETAGEGRPVSLEVLSQEADKMVEEAKVLYDRFNPIAENVVIKIPVNTRAGRIASDYEGLKAIKELSGMGIPVNATLVMTPEQALLASKAGATYVSPFAGRVDDFIRTNLGIGFEKGDYFDFELLKEIFDARLSERLRDSLSRDVASIFLDREVRKMRDIGGNNGIISGVEVTRKIVRIFREYGMKTKVIASSIRNARQVREVAEVGCDIATVPFKVLQEMLRHPKTEEGVERFYSDAIRAKYKELFGNRS